MKLVAVCGFGVGSSIIAKMNIESILQKRNREDIVVETIDLGSVQGADGDYYVLNFHCKCNNKRQGSDPWVYNGAYDNVH